MVFLFGSGICLLQVVVVDVRVSDFFNIKSTLLNCLECGSLKRGELDFVFRGICFRFYQEI